MPIYNIFVINRAGSLIYDYDCRLSCPEIRLSFNACPIDFKLDLIDNRLTVIFGERDNVRVGYIVVSVNDEAVVAGGRLEKSAESVFEILSKPDRFPLSIRFARPTLNTNEKIILSSMFHSLHAIAAQLSPLPGSSGIECLDTDSYRLHCFQTLTGLKFVCVADHGSSSFLDHFLRKLYELFADFAAKNPFYSLDMPIRCQLFDLNLKLLLEKFEKLGVINI